MHLVTSTSLEGGGRGDEMHLVSSTSDEATADKITFSHEIRLFMTSEIRLLMASEIRPLRHRLERACPRPAIDGLGCGGENLGFRA